MRSTSKPASPLPLREGDRGEVVLDLQLRLAELDLSSSDPPGCYGPSTAHSVSRFQDRRGLAADGVCDARTWAALVEAGYALGDRVLYRRSPMLRGDDVAELQRHLSSLGFDPGRIDGIFGDQTMDALMDFQRNAGLSVDGVCGRRTLVELKRITLRSGGEDLVSPLRERLTLATAGRGLKERKFAVGEPGGFPAGAAALCRVLEEAAATTVRLHHPDPSHQAAAANAAGVDCFLSLRIVADQEHCATAYYSGFAYESVTSRTLASCIQERLPEAIGLADGGIRGMAIPILRETRMPAVEVQLGCPVQVVQHTLELAEAIVAAAGHWVDTCFD